MPDTLNWAMVGVNGDRIVAFGRFMSKTQALQLAAWLVVLADPLDETFSDLLEAVKQT